MFPFSGKILATFDKRLINKDIDIGFYNPYITSIYFVGRSITAPFWGKLADNYGRKPTLLISMILSSVFVILFA